MGDPPAGGVAPVAVLVADPPIELVGLPVLLVNVVRDAPGVATGLVAVDFDDLPVHRVQRRRILLDGLHALSDQLTTRELEARPDEGGVFGEYVVDERVVPVIRNLRIAIDQLSQCESVRELARFTHASLPRADSPTLTYMKRLTSFVNVFPYGGYMSFRSKRVPRVSTDLRWLKASKVCRPW